MYENNENRSTKQTHTEYSKSACKISKIIYAVRGYAARTLQHGIAVILTFCAFVRNALKFATIAQIRMWVFSLRAKNVLDDDWMPHTGAFYRNAKQTSILQGKTRATTKNFNEIRAAFMSSEYVKWQRQARKQIERRIVEMEWINNKSGWRWSRINKTYEEGCVHDALHSVHQFRHQFKRIGRRRLRLSFENVAISPFGKNSALILLCYY